MNCLRFDTITKIILYIYPVLDNLVLTINDLTINWNTTLEDISSVATSLLLMKSLNKTETPIF